MIFNYLLRNPIFHPEGHSLDISESRKVVNFSRKEHWLVAIRRKISLIKKENKLSRATLGPVYTIAINCCHNLGQLNLTLG